MRKFIFIVLFLAIATTANARSMPDIGTVNGLKFYCDSLSVPVQHRKFYEHSFTGLCVGFIRGVLTQHIERKSPLYICLQGVGIEDFVAKVRTEIKLQPQRAYEESKILIMELAKELKCEEGNINPTGSL